jgi:hypothetical protein
MSSKASTFASFLLHELLNSELHCAYENTDPPELFLLLQQLLVEPSGCSATLYEYPSVDSSLPPELEEFFPLLCLSAHFLDALLAEFLRILSDSVSLNSQQSSFLCALLALAQCPPGRASQNSSELLSELTAEFLQLYLMHMLNSHLAELFTEFTAEFCLQLCLSYTALPPRYLATLRSSSSELLISVPVPQHAFV